MFCQWQLKVNVGKCGVMHYGNQDETRPYRMRDGTTRANMEVRKEEKDLGVTFDPSLKFSKHVGKVANKANRIVGLIRRTFAHMDEDMFCLLHKISQTPPGICKLCVESVPQTRHHKAGESAEKGNKNGPKH